MPPSPQAATSDDLGFVPNVPDTHDDLGFVPNAQTAAHDDLGFIPNRQPQPNMGPAQAALIDGAKNVLSTPEQAWHPKNATDFKEAWLAGWQGSVTGLGITHQSLPDYVMPEDAGRFARIISMAGGIAGDMPAMLAGAVGGRIVGTAAGGVAGSVIGPEGTVAGAAVGGKIGQNAGAFALPAALRSVLMDHYKKGDVQSFSDFYDRSSAAFLAALKAGTVGAATGAAGLAAGKLAPIAMNPMLKLGAVTAAEGATMTTVGKALDGKVPNASDFEDTAMLLGAMHLAGAAAGVVAKPVAAAITNHIQNKLMDTYAQTGLHPLEQYEMASQDPVLRQQLLSDDPHSPQSLSAANQLPDQTVEINPNPELTKPNPSLSQTTINEGDTTLRVGPIDKNSDPAAPMKPGESVERSEAEKAILDRIGQAPEKEPVKYDWNKFYYQYVDKTDPIKVARQALAGDEVPEVKDDPWALVRQIPGNGKRAEAAIEAGPADFNTLKATGTPGLKEILERHEDNLDGFKAYLVAKRAVELNDAGKETGMPIDQAKQVIKEGKSTFEKSSKDFVQFNNDILKYGKDAGLMSDQAFEKIVEANKNYVSFKRVMDEAPEGGSGTGRGLTPFNPVKELKGSERQIIDPIQSTIENTQAMIASAEKNRAMLKLTDLIDKAKNEDFTKVKSPMQAIDITQPEVAKFLSDQGLDPEDADSFTVFRPNKEALANDQIVSYKDGKRQVYEVPELLARSVKGLDDGNVQLLTKFLSAPAKGLRTGMIASPDFMARHFIRQEFMSTIFSKDRYVPIMTTLQGLGGILGKSDEYYDWLRAGGANSIAEDMNNSYLKNNIYGLNEETGFMDKAWNTIKSPLEGLKMVTQILDESRTFGKYKAAIAAGKDTTQSAFEARDSAIDVARVGASLRAWNMVTPFENMRIQGLDLIGRNFQENPTATTARLATTLTLPSVLLWYANHDDPRWRDIPNYVKDTSWVFMTKDHTYMVPKPFEPGVVFGSLPERVLEQYFTDNPRAFKDFQKAITESALPQYVPAFASPILETYANKSLMTGAPLISDHMKNVLPAYQANPYTSTTAKIGAGILRQIPSTLTQNPGSLGSPIIIDNFIRDWGGNLGQYATQAMDYVLEKSGAAKAIGINYNENPPEKTLSDIPFIKAFMIRYPSANSAAIGDFYDRFEQTQARLNTIKMLAKSGDTKNLEKEYMAAQAQGQMVNLTGYKTAISTQMQLIQKIYSAPDMDPHEKRQQIDKFYTLILNEAHGANQILDNIEKAVGK